MNHPDDFRGLPGERFAASQVDELDPALVQDADKWGRFDNLRAEYRRQVIELAKRMNDKIRVCLGEYLNSDDDNAFNNVNDQIAACMAQAEFHEELTA